MNLHPKIAEIKQRSSPISYGSLAVNEYGELLKERTTLLDERQVQGYAVIWGVPNLHGEVFVKGAFAKSIRDRGPGSGSNYEIKFLNQHDPKDPLALFQELVEDEYGLYFLTKPLDPVDSADRALIQLRSGTLNNFSHGFDWVWDKVEWDETRQVIVVKEAILFEISVVSIPSGMETYMIRSKEDLEDMFDETNLFIKSLPRKNQDEARNLFARHKSLMITEPFEQRKKTLEESKPTEASGIDYNYLIENL